MSTKVAAKVNIWYYFIVTYFYVNFGVKRHLKKIKTSVLFIFPKALAIVMTLQPVNRAGPGNAENNPNTNPNLNMYTATYVWQVAAS